MGLVCFEAGIELNSIATIEMRLKEEVFLGGINFYCFNATKCNVVSIVVVEVI